jgi:SAM-dependent methyltransferase
MLMTFLATLRSQVTQRVRAVTPPLVRRLPEPVLKSLRDALGSPVAAARSGPSSASYEALYEEHGRALPAQTSIGGGDFDLIGRIELGILQMEGLRPTDTVVDFGCGTSRLAVHLIPYLDGGQYIGIDIADSMLVNARMFIQQRVPVPKCRITWTKQTSENFTVPDKSVDLICAFSVFTHMEHEDVYRYLVAAKRIVRPGGKFIFSCLPMTLAAAQQVFCASANLDLMGRWSAVRTVTTTVDMMDAVSRLSGWTVVRWYDGSERNITVPRESVQWGLGQSTCVLERPIG